VEWKRLKRKAMFVMSVMKLIIALVASIRKMKMKIYVKHVYYEKATQTNKDSFSTT